MWYRVVANYDFCRNDYFTKRNSSMSIISIVKLVKTEVLCNVIIEYSNLYSLIRRSILYKFCYTLLFALFIFSLDGLSYAKINNTYENVRGSCEEYYLFLKLPIKGKISSKCSDLTRQAIDGFPIKLKKLNSIFDYKELYIDGKLDFLSISKYIVMNENNLSKNEKYFIHSVSQPIFSEQVRGGGKQRVYIYLYKSMIDEINYLAEFLPNEVLLMKSVYAAHFLNLIGVFGENSSIITIKCFIALDDGRIHPNKLVTSVLFSQCVNKSIKN